MDENSPILIDSFSEFFAVQVLPSLLENHGWLDPDPSNPLSSESLKVAHRISPDFGTPDTVEITLPAGPMAVNSYWFYAAVHALNVLFPGGLVGTTDEVVALLESVLTMPYI